MKKMFCIRSPSIHGLSRLSIKYSAVKIFAPPGTSSGMAFLAPRPFTGNTITKHRGDKVRNSGAFRARICAPGYDEAKVATRRLVHKSSLDKGEEGLSRKYRGAIKTFRVLSWNLFRLCRASASGRESSVRVILRYNNNLHRDSKSMCSTSALMIPNFPARPPDFVRILTMASENSPARPFSPPPPPRRIHAALPSKSYTSSKVSLITRLRTLGELYKSLSE